MPVGTTLVKRSSESMTVEMQNWTVLAANRMENQTNHLPVYIDDCPCGWLRLRFNGIHSPTGIYQAHSHWPCLPLLCQLGDCVTKLVLNVKWAKQAHHNRHIHSVEGWLICKFFFSGWSRVDFNPKESPCDISINVILSPTPFWKGDVTSKHNQAFEWRNTDRKVVEEGSFLI